MPRPKVSSEMTTSDAAREVGMSTGQLIRWVNANALPAPTRVDKNGVRYFDEGWLEEAREILNRKRGNG